MSTFRKLRGEDERALLLSGIVDQRLGWGMYCVRLISAYLIVAHKAQLCLDGRWSGMAHVMGGLMYDWYIKR